MVTLPIIDKVRIDQHFAYNITNFKDYSKEDEQLLKDLIIYMSRSFQKNLFGFIDIDVADFCRVMKLTRGNVVGKHSDPIFYKLFKEHSKKKHLELQEKHGTMSRFRIWDSKLENALLILKNERFYFSEEQTSGKNKKINILDFSYIKEINIIYKKVGKTRKIIYQYKPTEEFEQKLIKFFLETNLNIYISLRKPSLEDFYLKLIHRMQSSQRKGENTIFYNINELADLMNVSADNIDQPKGFSYVKQNINRKFNKHFVKEPKEDLKNISLSWKKGNHSKYNNIAVISWAKMDLSIIKANENAIYIDLFFTEMLKSLSVNFQDNYMVMEFDKIKLFKNFVLWLFSSKDNDVKKSIYVATYSKIRGNKGSSIEKAGVFFADLTSIGIYIQKYNLIKYSDDTILFEDKEKGKIIEFNELKDFIYTVHSKLKYFQHNYKI